MNITSTKTILLIISAILLFAFSNYFNNIKKEDLPVVAIANYGPHSSLEDSIKGIKKELAEQGFLENKNIRFEILDVNFDTSLIPQMMSTLKSYSPKVIVVMSTLVAQFAKGSIKNIPLIYNVITDPIEAGLIEKPYKPHNNITGSSDKQSIPALLNFTQQILPNAKRIGFLYSTSETNDLALLKMLKQTAANLDMEVLAIPIDQAKDIPVRMQNFNDKVDFIYVGSSGTIQPTLPTIAAEANKMGIGVLNVNEEAVEKGLVLASFGVNYQQVGINAGKLVAKVLNGKDISTLLPIYPSLNDHHGFINKKKAQFLGITIPDNLKNVKIIG